MPYKKMKGLGQISTKEVEMLKKTKVAPKTKTNKGLGQLSVQEIKMIRNARMNMNKKPK